MDQFSSVYYFESRKPNTTLKALLIIREEAGGTLIIHPKSTHGHNPSELKRVY